MPNVGAAASASLTPAPDDCLAQLKRIIDSPDFDATARERRFLQYIVEETSAGHEARIKAYTIATEVFGRDSSFDAQNDPIVRIAAGHLRRALERYYLTAGAPDPIVIAVPKGGYVPTFSVRTTAKVAVAPPPPQPTADPPPVPRPATRRVHILALAAAVALVALAAFLARPDRNAAMTAAGRETTRLLVERFDDLGGTMASADITTGLTQEIIGQLSRFRDITVVERDLPGDGQTGSAPRYALLGSVWLTPASFRLRVRLVNRSDGAVLWAESYDGSTTVSEVVQVQTDIAENVATNLAQVYGVIFQADTSVMLSAPPDDWDAYACTLSFYSYRATMDRAVARRAHDCLERAVVQNPEYSTAWALFALSELDALRVRFPYDPAAFKAENDRILNAARRAVSLDPQNVRALQAEMFALYFSGRHAEGRSVGERALALNPNDTELLGEFGYRLALSGNWDEGCPLMQQARDRNPGPLAYYESGLALCAYFAGDLAEAERLIIKSGARGHPLYHIMAAAMCGEAGNLVCAGSSRKWLETNAPELVANARQEAALRFGRPEDVDRFLGSLVKAGLVIPDAAPAP